MLIVKAKSVKDYLNKYYKKSRMTPTLLETYEKEYKECGYVCTSHHDNVIGEFIGWPYDKDKAIKFKLTFEIGGYKQVWHRFGKTLESTLESAKIAIRDEWPSDKVSKLCIYSPPNY